MRRLCFTIALLTVTVCMVAAAPDLRPNFSGTWVMNPDKTDFGPLPKPDKAKYVIRHSGPNIGLDYTQDADSKHIDVVTDGEERVTESDDESELWTRVSWSGPVLVWEARRRAKPAHEVRPVSWVSRWTLSEDGKTLTINRRITAGDQSLNEIMVLDKQ
jgi:hypothetical protein